MHGQAMRAPYRVTGVAQRRLHRQRRIAGPPGMLLMRQRGAKEGQNPIPHNLMHRGHHPLQHRLKELPRVLRIAIGEAFHRAFEVRKQHRDPLALAFERTVGG
jgi:hypothetical protein